MQMVSDVDLDFLESPTQILTRFQLHAGVHSHQTPLLLYMHLCFACSSCSVCYLLIFFIWDLSKWESILYFSCKEYTQF